MRAPLLLRRSIAPRRVWLMRARCAAARSRSKRRKSTSASNYFVDPLPAIEVEPSPDGGTLAASSTGMIDGPIVGRPCGSTHGSLGTTRDHSSRA